MRLPRLHVRTAMIVVAVVAMDFTAIRAVFSRAMTFGVGLSVLINTIPIGLALNFGLLRILRARGRAQMFWVGFVVCGTLTIMSSAWAALTPLGWVHPRDGTPNYFLVGSTIWWLWNSYFDFTVNCLKALGFDLRSFSPPSLDNPGIGFITIVGLMSFIPQLVIALVGGWVTWSIMPKRPVSPVRMSPE